MNSFQNDQALTDPVLLDGEDIRSFCSTWNCLFTHTCPVASGHKASFTSIDLPPLVDLVK